MAGYINLPSAALSTLTTIFNRGADLTDADTTLQPFTDRAWFYVLPAGTLTASRTFTLGNTNFYNTAGMFLWCGILRYDTSANTVVVKKADTTTIYTDPASPAAARLLVFACDATGVWAASQYIWHINTR